jgi:ribosomal 30S subunit maturation factor RimM
MEHGEIHVEILVGRAVVDAAGRRLGRLEEIMIEREGDEWVVKEYLIDGYGALERFAGWTIARAIFQMQP